MARRIICKWSAPKPGHEFQYRLAWKHRVYWASLFFKYTSPWPWHNRTYRRVFRNWSDAVERVKIHGMDVESGA